MSKIRDPDQVELESQFILRLPPEPSKTLRELISSGINNFKDRLTIKVENDMRYGEVRVENCLLRAKVVDMPTVIESLKTIDNKSFYKTADICQMMICKEDDDVTSDEESPQKFKKKDPNKVEKKYLLPHGITPPLKNVRRRRFRRTLRKKFVEAPEIEKEVKRLLRGDSDSVAVRWEIINEEEDKKDNVATKQEKRTLNDSQSTIQKNVDVAEHDIFGEAVSDSDEEDPSMNMIDDMEESSRLSAEDDSRISDSISINNTSHSDNTNKINKLVTQFSKEMFTSKKDVKPDYEEEEIISRRVEINVKSQLLSPEEQLSVSEDEPLRRRMAQLQNELQELKMRAQQQETEMANIENFALRQRFQAILEYYRIQIHEKEQELDSLAELSM